jgi:tetratricopeptide (TPR) repeat protein
MPSLQVACLRHSQYFLTVVQNAEKMFQQNSEGMNQGLILYTNEFLNIGLGHKWAESHLNNKIAIHLCIQYVTEGIHIHDLRLHPKEWIQWLELAEKCIKKLDLRNTKNEAVIIGALGRVNTYFGDYFKALYYSKHALTIHNQLKDYQNQARVLGNIGVIYKNTGKIKKAINAYKDALEIFQTTGNLKDEAIALGNLGILYKNLGDYKTARGYYDEQLRLSRMIGDQVNEVNALGNLCIYYRHLGKTDEALLMCEEQLKVARKISYEVGKGTALNNKADIYFLLEDIPSAIMNYKEAQQIFKNFGDRRLESVSLDGLGNAYLAQEEISNAEDCFLLELKIAQEIKNPGCEGDAWSNLSQIHHKKNDDKAIEYAYKAYQYYKKINSPKAKEINKKIITWKNSK